MKHTRTRDFDRFCLFLRLFLRFFCSMMAQFQALFFSFSLICYIKEIVMDWRFICIFSKSGYQEFHNYLEFSFLDQLFKNYLFIYGLLDIVLHNWIIEICVYPFCNELKSGNLERFTILDTTDKNREWLHIDKLNFFQSFVCGCY